MRIGKIRHQSTTATKPSHAQVEFVEFRGAKEAKPGPALKKKKVYSKAAAKENMKLAPGLQFHENPNPGVEQLLIDKRKP